MIGVENVRHVGVVGAGTVGASWALYFLSRGLRVSVQDTNAAREAYVSEYVARGWPLMRELRGELAATPPSVEFHTGLDALRDVQFVQESVPDDLMIKRALFAELDHRIPAQVVVGSSTSSLLMTELQQGLATASRFVVAHPFNPPHLIPIVEIAGGASTAASVVDYACALFSRLGKTVLRLRKEVRGHLVNRLQAALFQEAVWLVREGVASVADIDRGMSLGPGLRWAAAGPFLTFHLGAGAGGIRSYLEHLGSAHERMWEDLQSVGRIAPEVVEQIANGIGDEAGDATVEQLTAERDQTLIRLLRLISGNVSDPADRNGNREEES